MLNNSPYLKLLDLLFPGLLLISAAHAGTILSYKKQTTRNKIKDGSFPIETLQIGAKTMVRKIDLALYLDGLDNTNKNRGVQLGIS